MLIYTAPKYKLLFLISTIFCRSLKSGKQISMNKLFILQIHHIFHVFLSLQNAPKIPTKFAKRSSILMDVINSIYELPDQAI
jgi:hypothetical protein